MIADNDLIFHERTERIFKIIIVGDPAVGKTSLLRRFCAESFAFEYIPTVGVNITKQKLTIKNDIGKETDVSLMIWDIAGQPQFYMLHRPYFNGADGMILTYDVTRSSSFSNVNNWYNTSVKYGLSGIPCILMGINDSSKNQRKVTLTMANYLSEKLNVNFFEITLPKTKKLQEVFKKMAELTLLSKLHD
ncbi:MAG: Rab family GTPase [Promethearchaeota archaeon]|jgi:small GTP-binding protein